MDLLPWEALVISIHTLHTEGDTTCPHYDDMDGISIHTLHTEGDSILICQDDRAVFQSTPSTRRVTPCGPTKRLPKRISIHTLHTEGDYPQISPTQKA